MRRDAPNATPATPSAKAAKREWGVRRIPHRQRTDFRDTQQYREHSGRVQARSGESRRAIHSPTTHATATAATATHGNAGEALRVGERRRETEHHQPERGVNREPHDFEPPVVFACRLLSNSHERPDGDTRCAHPATLSRV